MLFLRKMQGQNFRCFFVLSIPFLTRCFFYFFDEKKSKWKIAMSQRRMKSWNLWLRSETASSLLTQPNMRRFWKTCFLRCTPSSTTPRQFLLKEPNKTSEKYRLRSCTDCRGEKRITAPCCNCLICENISFFWGACCCNSTEVLRDYLDQILRIFLKVLKEDNEENAVVCLTSIFTLHKGYRSHLENQVCPKCFFFLFQIRVTLNELVIACHKWVFILTLPFVFIL